MGCVGEGGDRHLRERSAGVVEALQCGGTEGQRTRVLTAKLLLSHMCKTLGMSLEKLYFQSNL